MKTNFSDEKLRELISQMTLKEKAAQMTQLNANLLDISAGDEITGPAAQMNLTKDEVAAIGSTLNVKGVQNVINLQKNHLDNDRNKIPLLFMMDVIHGCRTIYPVPLALGCTFEPKLVEDLCSMAAKESTACGIQVTFSPMADLARDARWGRVVETTGEDPYMNGLYAAAAVKGYQGDLSDENKVAACLKHFACYGAAEAGRDYNTVDMSERTAREFYLTGYKASVDAGVAMAMTSFNIYDGIPLTANAKLTQDLLKKEWGFDGVIISDYNAFGEMKQHGFEEKGEKIAEYAFKAGEDIEMMSLNYLKHLEDLVANGTISEKEVDEAVFRCLKLKRDLGVMDNPYRGMSVEREKNEVLTKENRDLVRVAAEKSSVLLKNDGILPLKGEKVALIGPFADSGNIMGTWRCYGDANDTTTVKAAFEQQNIPFEYAKGCEYGIFEEDESGFSEAIEVAKKCDTVVMCVGEAQDYSGESKSRGNIAIPDLQVKLIKEINKVNKNVVLVLFGGRPLTLYEILPYAKAVAMVWQPGTEGGSAIANLLTGKANFEGKLSMTFPYHVAQCPIYYNHMSTGRPKNKDVFVDGKYRNDASYISMYVDIPNAPLYPYGYGLSYSSFEVSPVTLSADKMEKGGKLTASVTVKNTSSVPGSEVLQLYIHDNFASRVRPVKELKGYEKVFLNAGEEKTVTFTVTEKELAFWDKDMIFKAEEGEFELFIGTDSNTDNKAEFTLI